MPPVDLLRVSEKPQTPQRLWYELMSISAFHVHAQSCFQPKHSQQWCIMSTISVLLRWPVRLVCSHCMFMWLSQQHFPSHDSTDE